MHNHPPIFDGISNEELGDISMEASLLVRRINELREKSLFGGGLDNTEVLEGIRCIIAMRKIRSGAKGQNELPPILERKLSEDF